MAAVLDKPKPTRKSKGWTYEECSYLDDDRRYELYHGKLIPMTPPSPDADHQSEALEVALLLRAFVREEKLGQVFIAPLDVVFDDANTAQPDVFFVSKKNPIAIGKAVFGAPDLVVEILSPGRIRRDRYDKQELYARFGVKESWILDRANRSLEVLTLSKGSYVVHSAAGDEGHVTSKVLRGLKVKLGDFL